ncbi:MAG: radical SAM protein [Candidatus Helarchaeota archaeon]|nr:radical SAM protein [Candidatus Helarchaeota archaeon]
MARIVLINPAPVLHQELGIKTRQKSWPPLGLLYNGEILSREGHEVKILDQDVLGYSYSEVMDWIKKRNPEILGLSPLTISLESSLQIAKLAKEWNDNLIIVFGNVLATLAYTQLLSKYEYIDYCLRGETETTFPKFVGSVMKSRNLKEIPGLSYREHDLIKSNPRPPLNRNLDAIPIPDREKLVDFNYRIGPHKFTVLATSRGCPFRCKFCAVHLVSDSREIWRPRSIENILTELHFLQSRGYEEFSFVDDCFIVNQKRTVKLCQRMRKEKIDMVWSCEGRVDKGSKEVFRTMHYANCNNLMLGIESASQRMLDYYNKNITPELSKKVIKNARKAGIENIAGLFVVGGPDETVQEIIRTLKFGLELDLTFLQYQLLHVLLGSEIWNEAVKQGLINEEKDWNKYVIASDIYPTAVKREIIEKLIDKAFVEFLSRPKFLLKEIFRTVKSPYRLQNIFNIARRKSK